MEEIKKCPLCGEQVYIKDKCVSITDGVMSFIHFCNGYTAKKGISISLHGESVDEIISLWNREIRTEAVD